MGQLAGIIQYVLRDLDNQLFTVVGILQVNALIGVHHHGLATANLHAFARLVPHALSPGNNLEVVDGIKFGTFYPNVVAVAELGHPETGKFPEAETGLPFLLAQHFQAMLPNMLVNKRRHLFRMCPLKDCSARK